MKAASIPVLNLSSPRILDLTLFHLAMRQTWEEIGLDLAESDYTCVGQLDDREITTSLGKRLLMILSPFGQLLSLPYILLLLKLSKFSSNLPQPKHLPSLFPKPPSIGYRCTHSTRNAPVLTPLLNLSGQQSPLTLRRGLRPDTLVYSAPSCVSWLEVCNFLLSFSQTPLWRL